MKKKWVILLTVIIIMLAGTLGIRAYLESNLEKLVALPITKIDLTKLADGIYSGSYEAFPVTAEVRVTISRHKISSIELVKHDNGLGKPAEVIPEKIVAAQSLDVDTISGATYSSKVILKAIENALNSTPQ